MWLLSGNSYMSQDGGYHNRCNNSDWSLAEAQAKGVDVGSSNATLPTIDELVALGHALLEF